MRSAHTGHVFFGLAIKTRTAPQRLHKRQSVFLSFISPASIRLVEPSEQAGPTEPAEPAEPAEPTEQAEQAEQAEPIWQAEAEVEQAQTSEAAARHAGCAVPPCAC